MFLCRSWDSVPPPDTVVAIYHYTGVEEGTPISLDRGEGYQGFLYALLCALGWASRGVRRALLGTARAVGMAPLCSFCRRNRQAPASSGKARDLQLDSESKGPSLGACGGDRLGWRQPGGTLGTLGLRSPCLEPLADAPAPLLAEDEPCSDVAGWERVGGNLMVPLCPRHSRLYHSARKALFCAHGPPPPA